MTLHTERGYFIAGIGTDVGKTIVASILAESLQAEYWKPVQCGKLAHSDSDVVRSLTSCVKIHPEVYRFSLPASPHIAARAEGVEVEMAKLKLPIQRSLSHKAIVVEGAGGIMVPLNPQALILDYIKYLSLPVILISKNYLGSINHTLLSIHALKSAAVSIKGIIFTGEPSFSYENAISRYSEVPRLGCIPWTSCLDRSFIANQANQGWLHELR